MRALTAQAQQQQQQQPAQTPALGQQITAQQFQQMTPQQQLLYQQVRSDRTCQLGSLS
jgi:hypothetical protein